MGKICADDVNPPPKDNIRVLEQKGENSPVTFPVIFVTKAS